ncbi:LTA synthase family protein [Paenibacillus sp. CAU 1782]
MSSNRVPVNTLIRRIQSIFERFVVLDTLLFALLMLLKLYWFNRLLSVLYMDMTRKDLMIEAGAVLLVSFWCIWLPPRARNMTLAVLNLALSLLLYGDVVYYRYFQDLITVPVLLQAGQVDSLGDSIGELLRLPDFWLFADLPLLFALAIALLWKGDSKAAKSSLLPRRRRLLQRGAAGIVALCLGAGLFFGGVHHATETWAKGLFQKNWWNLSIYNVTGGLGFHGYDVYRYAKLNWFGAETVTAEQRSDTEQWLAELDAERSPLQQDSLFGAYEGSNVLILQMEALQSFVLGQSIGGKEITPNLNALMESSAHWTRFYHQTAQGRTSDADFGANCSLLPLQSGSVFIQYASHQFGCMPQQLKEQGYSTNVFHAYQGGFWNRNVMYANMKYDAFYSLKHFKLDEPLGWALGDKSFYRQSMEVISELEQPFHAFLISLTSHHPFKLPQAVRELDTEELDGTIMGDYLQSIHYADAALGELIQHLKDNGLWDNTILALYGDHDNSLTDWELYDRFMANPDSKLEREQTVKGVPFILHLPDNGQAGPRDAVGGQLDIAPTLLHLLGISAQEKGMLGMPLLTDTQDVTGHIVVQRNGSWTDGDYYYMPPEDGITGEGFCYSVKDGDLADSALCQPITLKSEQQLTISDRIIMGDLLRHIYSGRAVEVMGETSDPGKTGDFNDSNDAEHSGESDAFTDISDFGSSDVSSDASTRSSEQRNRGEG